MPLRGKVKQQYSKKYYLENKKEIQKKHHEWKEKKGLLKPRDLICPVCQKSFQRIGRGRKTFCSISCRNKAHYLKYQRFYKIQIFEMLGNKCSNPNCPIPINKLDKRALQIDHVNGGGCQERKERTDPIGFLKHVHQELLKGSKDFQLLCAYCNWIKRYTNDEL
jgi:hypothetical protein